MQTFLEIIELIKKREGYSKDSQIYNNWGVKKQTFNSWKKRNSIPIEYLSKYCKEENLNLNWFLTGEGHPEIPGSFDMPGEKDQLIPVVGLAQAGEGLVSDDQGYPVGAADEWISRPHGLKDPKAFGVVVEGDSMLPALKPNQRVIVSPNVPCRTGDRAVVKLKNDKVLIAEMRFNGDEVHLKKYNDEDIHTTRDQVVFCYKIMWAKEL